MNKNILLGKNGGRLGGRAFIKDLLAPPAPAARVSRLTSTAGPAAELLDVFDRIEAQLRLTQDRRAARDFSMEVRLAWLTGHVGNLANNTSHEHTLLRVAAVTMAWLEAMHLPMAGAFTAIADERARQSKQRESLPDGDCWRRLRRLVEKLGLVAQAVAEVEANPHSAACRNFLLASLVQVATEAVLWLQLDQCQRDAGPIDEETFNVEHSTPGIQG